MMKKLACSLALTVSLLPTFARAQVGVQIEIGLPARPALVAVQPGVQVVEGFREEVFYSGGWYWCRRGDAWYRARSPQARFAWVEPRRVPVALVRQPEGRYRNWHRAELKAEHREHERERVVHEERQEAREHHHDDR